MPIVVQRSAHSDDRADALERILGYVEFPFVAVDHEIAGSLLPLVIDNMGLDSR